MPELKFDEFSLVILGGIIFIAIFLLSFSTPSEFPPKASPSSVSLSLAPGSIEAFDVTVSGRITGVNVSASGELAGWMQISQADLGSIKESETVQVTVTVPDTASSGTRMGKIVVRSKEGSASVDVSVTVSGIKKLASRALPMGDFTVAYKSGVTTLGTEDETFVSKSYLFEKPVAISGTVEAEELPILNGGEVRFTVDGTNGYGPIIVMQNGRQIFRETVGAGEVIVPVNVSDVRRTNTFVIAADNPGIFFWAENIYSIRDVSVDLSFEGQVPKAYNFTLLPAEYTKLDKLQIAYSVARSTSPLPPMRVELNGQVLYLNSPPLLSFSREFPRDAFGGAIRVGEKNALRFSFDEPASYEIQDAVLVVFYRAS